MTKKLKSAFDEASKLPTTEQDKIGQWLLEELKADHKWDQVLSASADALSSLADEALEDHRAGKTKPLDPTKL